LGTSIATALEGKVRLEVNPRVPATKFVEVSGKSYNTIPPSDFSFFEMINANVQQEPADSYDPELAGQLAAIGIEGEAIQSGRSDAQDTHRRCRGRKCRRTRA
jgi:hypothetical protein